jgi:hypothetical protein
MVYLGEQTSFCSSCECLRPGHGLSGARRTQLRGCRIAWFLLQVLCVLCVLCFLCVVVLFSASVSDTYGFAPGAPVLRGTLASMRPMRSMRGGSIRQDFADPLPDSFAAQGGSSFSRIRVRVGVAVARAAAARFMPDSAYDGLPVPVFGTRAKQHPHLPIPTISLYTTNRVSVSHVFLYVCACSINIFCSLCVHVHLCSLVHSLFLQLYGFVSFYTHTLYLLVMAFAFQ